MIETNGSSNYADGWFIFIVLLVASLVIPYYLVIFVVSVICDREVENKNSNICDNLLKEVFSTIKYK